jgi:hypothetical protein
MDWHRVLTYKTDFTTIRNYLGEARTFEIVIKTFMINLFLVLAPIGAVMEIVKNVVIYPHSSRISYFP